MHTDDGVSGAGNGIAKIAAVDFGDAHLVLEAEIEKEAGKEFVGVGASEMDVTALVTTLTLGDVNLEVD